MLIKDLCRVEWGGGKEGDKVKGRSKDYSVEFEGQKKELRQNCERFEGRKRI